MKPVLQALVLADHVYKDAVSGKMVIAGTFNQIAQATVNPPVLQDPKTGKQRFPVIGGSDMGCPWFYLSLTDVVGGTEISLQFVHRAQNDVLFELPIKIEQADRLATLEISGPLPPLGTILTSRGQAGEYSFDVICEGEMLGSHRVLYRIIEKAENGGPQ